MLWCGTNELKSSFRTWSCETQNEPCKWLFSQFVFLWELKGLLSPDIFSILQDQILISGDSGKWECLMWKCHYNYFSSSFLKCWGFFFCETQFENTRKITYCFLKLTVICQNSTFFFTITVDIYSRCYCDLLLLYWLFYCLYFN